MFTENFSIWFFVFYWYEKKIIALSTTKKEFGLSMWTNRNILKTEYWKSHLSEKDWPSSKSWLKFQDEQEYLLIFII